MKTLKIILGIVVVAGVLMLGWYLSSIVIYIVISTVLALIGRPLVDKLHQISIKNIKVPVSISAAITLLVLWGVLLVFFIVFIPLVLQEGRSLSNIDVNQVVENLKQPIETVQNLYNEYSPSKNISIQDVFVKEVKSLVSIANLSSFFSSVTNILGNIFIALFSISFITFFFLKEKNMLTRFILVLVPTKWDSMALHAILSIKKLLSRYFIGLLIQVSLIFIGLTIGLSIVGLDFNYVLLIAFFAAVINVIPYIGPIIGILFGIVISIITNLDLGFYDSLLPLLGYVLIAFLSVQILDNFIFQPLIFSNSVKAHPLEIFLVILIAGSLFGILGMVIAIPSYTIIRVIAKEFFSKYEFIEKFTKKI